MKLVRKKEKQKEKNENGKKHEIVILMKLYIHESFFSFLVEKVNKLRGETKTKHIYSKNFLSSITFFD